MTALTSFPDDFLFGAATSALQIEGSPLADGAGPSNWQAFCHQPGRTDRGDHADVACDHYRRYPEDIALMKAIGLQAYRFSVSWSRVLPEGRGRLNPKGLDFYKRLLETLHGAGLIPFVTLHHWDLPLALMHRGGWLNQDIAGWFSDYADLMFRSLGDHVRHWTTFNEPWVIIHMGFVEGTHPPALKDPVAARSATHHLLLAHGRAVQAFRASGTGEIGLVVNLEPKHPASDLEQDRKAAALSDAWMNRQFLEPVRLGRYPKELSTIWGSDADKVSSQDMALIKTPIDFLGINYYSRSLIRSAPDLRPFGFDHVPPPQDRVTDMGWEIYPDGLFECLNDVHQRYGELPLYITENGAAFEDGPPERGRVRDLRRMAYLKSHLRSTLDALAAGLPVKGYFAWSLLDNFEWTFGYSKRFGLIHVDFSTQARTLKDSAHLYRTLIERRGASLRLGEQDLEEDFGPEY